MWGTNDNVFMARYSAFNPYRIRHRDMGFPTPIGSGDALAKSLYCGMKPTYCWQSNDYSTPTGGIYNLEFSPDGSLLVAACEKRAIQIFDPLNHHRIHCMVGAHMDCVNGVKFIDSRMFATCSDDTTIALWDIRNLNTKIYSLVGHSKWVKNIEFSKEDKLLVTSGLDGSIFTWNINSFERNNLHYQRVFHTTSLMRCRLSPDSKQMILSTTGGLIMLIHNLNLSTLGTQLLGFRPNLYRLMQMSLQDIPVASKFDHLFDADVKENRVEFITDFPEDNDAEVVSSLQIHPQGWTALSRNISHDDASEWTCIHDIQSYEGYSDKSTRDPSPQKTSRGRVKNKRLEGSRSTQRLRRSPRLNRQSPVAGLPRRTATRFMVFQRDTPRGDANRTGAEANQRRGAEANRRRGEEANGTEREDERVEPVAGPSNRPSGGDANDEAPEEGGSAFFGRGGIPNDLWEASISIKQQRILQDLIRRSGSVRRNFNMQRITGINTGISPPLVVRPPCPTIEDLDRLIQRSFGTSTGGNSPLVVPDDAAPARPSLSGMTPSDASGVSVAEWESKAKLSNIRQNRKRLLYYVEETNLGKGFIKELCYSADGRVVCSPFGKGIRLLALDNNCSEIPSVIGDLNAPRQMHEVGQSLGYHLDLVVCTKFNPRFHSLVSGCLEGKIVWYQPYSGELNN